MDKETEIRLYEIAFGVNARPEHLNNLDETHKRDSFTEQDLIDQLSEFESNAHKFDNLHQGSEIDNGQAFITLVCDKDDLNQRVEENQDEFSEEELKELFEYSKRKLTDTLMDDFWLGIDAMIFEIKQRRKQND